MKMRTSIDNSQVREPLNLDFLAGLSSNPLMLQFTIALNIAGVLMEPVKAEWDEVLDIELEMTLNRAKEMRLEAVDQYVRNYGHRTKYSIIETDTKIVENVLKGRYKNFDDLNKAVTSSYGNSEEFAYILYKAIESSNLDKKNKHVIDSIYV